MCSRILTRKVDDDYVYVDGDVDVDVDVDVKVDGVVDVHDHDDDSTLCSRILTADEWEQECRPILEILDTRSFTNNCQNNCRNNCQTIAKCRKTVHQRCNKCSRKKQTTTASMEWVGVVVGG